ncbi:MAG: cell envelope integrity EipB family protein [Rhizobiaceae bacterium]|nr:cell envelope integrity EipB family protein [Rhizobiaceae bacterium]
MPLPLRRPVAPFVLAAAFPVVFPVADAWSEPVFASHRAVYDVKMERADEQTGISGMEGRLVFQFEGSQCDGYTMNMRFVLRMQLPEDVRITDQQTTTFESGDGSEFNFLTKTFTDEKLDKELKGSAARTDEGISVEIEKPDAVDVKLEPSQFPTMHLSELITKAKAGERFYETTLFDGTDEGDRLQLTSVVIGRQEQPEAGDPELAKADELAGKPFWPVEIAYFDPLAETGGEALPQYRIAFKLYESGITRDLVMDYNDFTLSGTLVDLEMMETPACE